MQTNSRKVAIVTASGRGIGAEIAQLAEAGYAISLMSPSGAAEELAHELGGVGITGSVTSLKDLEALVEGTLSAFGRVDAVVHNIGHLPIGDLLDLDDRAWVEGFEMIILSIVRMMRLVTPIFTAQGKGAVVNISAYGAVAPDQAFPISSSLRAALSAFTKLYAQRYAKNNIRMNSVLPGFVNSWEASSEIIERIPMGRLATTQEVASTVGFLLSDAASYITGQNILVDGAFVNAI